MGSTASTTGGTASGTARRAGLDRDDVVDAALALVEAHGAAALTMRRLATELGVTTTTIYWHVGGRDELVTALIARLADRQADLHIDGATPRDRVMCVARRVWTSALDHRNVTALAHQVGATSLLELPLERALARELDAAGVHGEAARDALRSILMCVAGFLVVAFRADGRGPGRTEPTGPDALWGTVDDPAIDPSTVAALRRPPQLSALFKTTLSAVVAAFVPAGDAVTPADAPPTAGAA